ncbi:glycogen-binding domain-containing protein [Sulfuriferula plumbiphila]|nr:glycogen-binding domain-containing protein [Sulfuriferula plumbiphila]
MSDTLLLLLLPINRRLRLALALTLALPWAYAAADRHEATFSLYAPQAKSVEVIGDFNQWQSGVTLLVGPDEKGMWRAKLPLPTTLTRIEYVYWVDGAQRRIDPGQPVVQDGFFGENNVLVLP